MLLPVIGSVPNVAGASFRERFLLTEGEVTGGRSPSEASATKEIEDFLFPLRGCHLPPPSSLSEPGAGRAKARFGTEPPSS